MIFERPNPTIVVGYDGSPAALAAVEHAIGRALSDGRLVLVHAYTVPVDYVAASYYAELQQDAAANAETMLDDLERDCEHLVTVEHERDITVEPPRRRSSEPPRSTTRTRSSSAAAATAACAPCSAASPTT